MSEEDKIEPNPEQANKTNASQPIAAQHSTTNQTPDIITPDISTSDIKQMEVHHHPHVEKKNFKEYLLEFLMIFIAVSLGFFAESFREHLTDKAREKEYIESLVQDLRIDQQVLSENIATMQSGISMMDSMIYILDHPAMIASNSGQLYYLARLAPRLQPLPINDKTFEQLKNSGNFRLIKNINLSNKIMDYYKKIPLVRVLESINETEFTQYKIVVSKIFNPEIFVSTEGSDNIIHRLNGNPPLRTTDNELLQQLSIFAVYMHGTKKGIAGADREIKENGAALIDYLQKEYHLRSD